MGKSFKQTTSNILSYYLRLGQRSGWFWQRSTSDSPAGQLGAIWYQTVFVIKQAGAQTRLITQIVSSLQLVRRFDTIPSLRSHFTSVALWFRPSCAEPIRRGSRRSPTAAVERGECGAALDNKATLNPEVLEALSSPCLTPNCFHFILSPPSTPPSICPSLSILLLPPSWFYLPPHPLQLAYCPPSSHLKPHYPLSGPLQLFAGDCTRGFFWMGVGGPLSECPSSFWGDRPVLSCC